MGQSSSMRVTVNKLLLTACCLSFQMGTSRLFVLVTGASRGFGKCVAEEVVRTVAPECPIDLVLVARSVAGLSCTADAIEDIKRGIAGVEEVVVRQEAIDLGDIDNLESLLDTLLDGVGEMFMGNVFIAC